jgi:hypothetical protein
LGYRKPFPFSPVGSRAIPTLGLSQECDRLLHRLAISSAWAARKRCAKSRKETAPNPGGQQMLTRYPRARLCRFILFFVVLTLASCLSHAQGGPPYYTNDPGTPGNKNWEINLGYMPFLFNGQSTTHTPDVDINFGVGDRIQLTYEDAWLRVWNQGAPAKYGMGQDQLGVKWRFYDTGEQGMAFSFFPQLSVNNPNHAVQRGITPPGASLILPLEFTTKIGPLDVNAEAGYNLVHLGPDGWLFGLVVGHDFTKKLEVDAELYTTGTFHSSFTQPAFVQPVLDVGARYKLHRPFILLLMAGRGLRPAQSDQPYFVGYFGVQILLPPKSFDKE